ncbi:MAG: NUDIX hydrolase [Myxococcaceae bacterium]
MSTLPPDEEVVAIEVVEDLTASARCDEGFLHLRRLRCRNRKADGSVSRNYTVDVVDRPVPDAVAVLLWRQGPEGVEVLTRRTLRPAAYFRRELPLAIPDPESYLTVEELVAGVLEPQDKGSAGVKARAAAEVEEEAGYRVRPEAVELLGPAFFMLPGIISEKIHPTAVDVTGQTPQPPRGDGSPLEEGASVRWWPLPALLAACRRGEVADAKTELCVLRFLAAHQG